MDKPVTTVLIVALGWMLLAAEEAQGEGTARAVDEEVEKRQRISEIIAVDGVFAANSVRHVTGDRGDQSAVDLIYLQNSHIEVLLRAFSDRP